MIDPQIALSAPCNGVRVVSNRSTLTEIREALLGGPIPDAPRLKRRASQDWLRCLRVQMRAGRMAASRAALKRPGPRCAVIRSVDVH